MKKLAIAAFSLVLAVSVLTGCGCTNSAAPTESTKPSVMPTIDATRPTTAPTEPPMTTPATSDATEGTGMTGMDDMTGPNDATETTPPMSAESGRVKSHINGNF